MLVASVGAVAADGTITLTVSNTAPVISNENIPETCVAGSAGAPEYGEEIDFSCTVTDANADSLTVTAVAEMDGESDINFTLVNSTGDTWTTVGEGYYLDFYTAPGDWTLTITADDGTDTTDSVQTLTIEENTQIVYSDFNVGTMALGVCGSATKVEITPLNNVPIKGQINATNFVGVTNASETIPIGSCLFWDFAAGMGTRVAFTTSASNMWGYTGALTNQQCLANQVELHLMRLRMSSTCKRI